jgi:hypothetical protein
MKQKCLGRNGNNVSLAGLVVLEQERFAVAEIQASGMMALAVVRTAHKMRSVPLVGEDRAQEGEHAVAGDIAEGSKF